jgi:asparagine synthase (glutamine-hydrolysing)
MSVLSKSSLPFIPSDRVRTKMAIASEILAAPKEVTAQKLFACLYLMPPHVLDQAFVAESNKWMSIFDASYAGIKDELSVALAIDYSFYLQNDILTKVDRATMSTSLEGREPLLDHRIVEFVAQLPSHFKFGKSQKMILKDIVHRHIPEQLLKRPKTGFSPPIYSWLQKDLAYLLDDFLCTNMIKEAGVYNPEYVQKLKEHCKIGIGNHQLLWRILQFHMWYQAWGR